MSEKETSGFCLNCRRWLEFMAIYPSTCPYEGDCDRCSYFKEKEHTKYLLRKRKLIKEAFSYE